jgi:hypothetical protein
MSVSIMKICYRLHDTVFIMSYFINCNTKQPKSRKLYEEILKQQISRSTTTPNSNDTEQNSGIAACAKHWQSAV